MRSDEFKLPGGSYSISDIQNYVEYIIKMHETLKQKFLLFMFASTELLLYYFSK